jgi:hypothetical protein
VQESCHQWRDFAAVDEIVQYRLRCGVLQKVAAVVYHK